MKTFDCDANTKKMLKDISTTFGVPQSIVKQVWEFTIFTRMMSIKEDKNKLSLLNIPFIGTLGVKKTMSSVNDDGSVKPDVEAFIGLSDSFKKTVSSVVDGKYGELSEYLQKMHIHKVVDNYEL